MRHALRIGGRTLLALMATAFVGTVVACSSVTDSLLEADDPDLILPGNVNSISGATAVANGAIGRFRQATASNDCCWLYSGLLTDEWTTSSTFVQNDEIDQRHVQLLNTGVTGSFRTVNRVRTAANQAIPLLKQYLPTSTALIAEMYFIRGFAEMSLAQDYCNGIPLSDGSGPDVVFGDPLPVSEVFKRAVASFDTAVTTAATDTTAQGALIGNAAKTGKGRALLGLGQFAEAAQAVAGVPTTSKYQITFSTATTENVLWAQGFSAKRYSVGDSIEGNNRDIFVKNAVGFTSAKDARLPVTDTKFVAPLTVGQDGGTVMRLTNIYDRFGSIDAVNGTDARLIEAEAALKAGDATTWLSILNGLRSPGAACTATTTTACRITTIGTVTIAANALPALVDPGTPEGRISMQFREMAFWQWGRGQRLGNLRRLVRQYQRAVTDVFPEGVHFKAGNYGTDVNFPVVTDEENNPKFTGCIDRNA